MNAPLTWEEQFNVPGYFESFRKAPDIDLWRCKVCGHRSKRARTKSDRLCAVCVAPGPEAPTTRKPGRRRRRASKGRRRH